MIFLTKVFFLQEGNSYEMCNSVYDTVYQQHDLLVTIIEISYILISADI